MRTLLLVPLILLGVACTTALGDAGPEDPRDVVAPTPLPDAFKQLYDEVRAEMIASSPDVEANTLRVVALKEEMSRLRQELNQAIQKQRLASSDACATFKELVDRSWWSLVDKESHLPVRDVNLYLSTIGDKLNQDGRYARMSDAIARLSFVSNIHLSRQGDRWQIGIIYGRQMHRLCQHEGYETSLASPDSIIENICGGHSIYFSDEQINPAQRGPGYCSSG